ncbi:hypothetical protein CSQ93_24950 [Janthinobacterium sp. BJB426]|nr:hypothetical protein CSQ93_24950 [Janthinobacterium sp. BJB426]
MTFIRPDTLGRSSFFMNVRVGGERCVMCTVSIFPWRVWPPPSSTCSAVLRPPAGLRRRGHVMALIAWLKVHQLDLMTNEETRKHGIAFEVDFNNHETVDISIKLDLTERVTVKTGEAGRLDIQHLAEIQHMPAYADEFWKLYDGDTLLAEWRTPEATP